eukprot:CAMPEP_0202474044 /NCGR_PEP_ID=MMETSP1360-20130828/92170_1 /ASSEMBLY_ACC=CAM_ASM_000848 /TAXON_ID=515479 /ORGANISM="Licmophora paradoxa, Strain CCMP2313" /LENGTH=541 /DNA_ID=CAMNT_0049101141 /DNA_START=63 /DNA_END=1689 /DNA_ORIENTATION=+
MSSEELVFPWLSTNHADKLTAVKWTLNNSRYEIHVPTLDTIATDTLVTHCLQVKTKIRQAVANEAHQGSSFFRVLPRTLSQTLLTTWEQVLADDPPEDQTEDSFDAALCNFVASDATEEDRYDLVQQLRSPKKPRNVAVPADDPPEDQTEDSFDAALRNFVASDATEEDRYDLVQQLRSPKKPRNVAVQQFFYRLRELNGFVAWLPGNEPPLTANQLKQALYDGMPSTWRERFVDSGTTLANKTTAELCRYFRKQESKASAKQAENERNQKRNSSRSSQKNNNSKRVPHRSGRDHSQSKRPASSSRQGSSNKITIDPDMDCPFHAGHKWSECFQNAKNPNHRGIGSSQERSAKRAKTSTGSSTTRSSNNNYSTETTEERFVDSGTTLASKTTAELCRYFRKQESKAAAKQAENERNQKRNSSRSSPKNNNSKRVPPRSGRDHSQSKRPASSSRQGSSNKITIDPDMDCPFHAGHKWSECFQNAKNPNHRGIGSSQERSAKRAKTSTGSSTTRSNNNNYSTETTDSHTMDVDDELIDYDDTA